MKRVNWYKNNDEDNVIKRGKIFYMREREKKRFKHFHGRIRTVVIVYERRKSEPIYENQDDGKVKNSHTLNEFIFSAKVGKQQSSKLKNGKKEAKKKVSSFTQKWTYQWKHWNCKSIKEWNWSEKHTLHIYYSLSLYPCIYYTSRPYYVIYEQNV